jgi:hypothetical protein
MDERPRGGNEEKGRGYEERNMSVNSYTNY